MRARPHRTWSSMDHEEGIPSYLGRLTKAPLLTQQQEEELTRAVQTGDTGARQRLIESNMRLVINIAKTYRSRAVPLEDLIQEGAIGLMQAAERFDPDKDFGSRRMRRTGSARPSAARSTTRARRSAFLRTSRSRFDESNASDCALHANSARSPRPTRSRTRSASAQRN